MIPPPDDVLSLKRLCLDRLESLFSDNSKGELLAESAMVILRFSLSLSDREFRLKSLAVRWLASRFDALNESMGM